MKKFIQEFKTFALRGNMMDMAVGVIIGGAFSNFISALFNFLIMAFVLFCLLKAVNKLASLGHKKEAAAAPATKKCPYCMSEIPIAAVRCPHCTSHLMEEQNKNS